MKKALVLTGLCLLLSASISFSAATAVSGIRFDEPQPHPNTIYAKLKLNGQTMLLPLLTHPSDTIEEVKSQLADWIGVSPEQITLRFNGTVLQDELTLSFYGIGAGAIISASVA
jgi:ubiquitin domain-containing protein